MMQSERLRREVPRCEDPADYTAFDRAILEAASTSASMVEALEKALPWTDEDRDVGPWRETANDALAKAKGTDNG